MKQLSKDEFFQELQDYVSGAESQRQAAKKLGVTPTHLNDVLRRRKEPGGKIAAAMGLRAVITYTHVDDEKDEEK